MAPTITPDANNPDDVLFKRAAEETAQRYLGHDKATYGFILVTPTEPSGRALTLTLNPQGITQEEEAAVVITPTQGGGKFIENNGNIFKDINIEGTTGFLPLKGFKNKQGPALLQQAAARVNDPTNTLAASAFAKVSGYASFLELRSLFREYLQTHRSASIEVREKTQFYWVNGKDDETWLVEPISFRMSRQKSSPMTYNYSIRMRTIAKGGAAFALKPDQSEQATSVFSNVKRGLIAIRDRIDAANTLLNGSLSFFDQYRNLRSLVVEILSTGSAVSSALTKVAGGAADVIDLPRSLLFAASTSITNVFEGISNAADLVASPPLDAYEGMTTLRQQLDFVLSRPELFAKKWSSAWASATDKFNTAYGVQGDASSQVQPGTSRSGLVEATPTSGESIYQFAARVCGDPLRAHEIIVANNLKWPYFAPSQDERTAGTVAPGDTVLVPVDFTSNANDNLVSNTFGSAGRTWKDEIDTVASATTFTKLGLDLWRPNQWAGYTIEILSGAAAGQSRLVSSNDTKTLIVASAWTTVPTGGELFRIYFQNLTLPAKTGLEELMGVDLRIVYSPITKTWDITKNSNGDLGTIRGQDNLNQALTVKFITTQGELILHSWFGLKPVFGNRGTLQALFQLRLFFEQTLLSDSRVESVESLTVVQEGDKYRTESKIAVKGGLRSRFSSPLV